MAGTCSVGFRSGELQFDVAVEPVKALLAAQLRARGAEQQRQAAVVVGCVVSCQDAAVSVSATPSSRSANAARSSRLGWWMVL